MANKIKSRWTVTFDKGGANQLVLCSAGDFIANVLAFGGEQVVEDGDYIEAENSEPLAFANVKRPQKLVIHKDHADRETALEWCAAQDAAIPIGLTAPLTVEIADGDSYVYDPCAIQRWNFVPLPGGPHRTEATFELKCGALVLESGGGPPVDPGPGAQSALLYLAGSTGLLDAGGDDAEHREAIATWENLGTEDDVEQATAGERPLVIDADGLWLPGIAGNYGRVTHNANFSYGTDFMFRIDVVLPTYRPAGAVCLMSQAPVAGSYVFALYLEPTGLLTLYLSNTGAAWDYTYQSTVPLPINANEYVGIQMVKAGATLTFYLHGEMDSTLPGMVLGAQVAITNVNPPNLGVNLEIGSATLGTANLLEGLVQLVAVWQTAVGGPSADSYITATWARKFTGGVQTDYGDTTDVTVMRSGVDPASLNTVPLARFDGTNDSMTPATALALNAVDGVTIVWKGVLNRVTGTQDLVFLATAGANPRVLLRLNGSGVDVLVRRLDAEATATTAHATGLTASGTTTLAVVVNFITGSVALYSGAGGLTLLAVGATTSNGGPCDATDSSETRIMAGQAEANPAAGDVQGIVIDDRAYSLAELQAITAAL